MVQSWMWLLFGAVIVALLFVDLVVAGRHRGIPSFRSAASWSVAWTLVALAFTGVLAAWQGGTAAEQYLAGYLIERSLSLDNLFVFALLFGYFAVPAESQRPEMYSARTMLGRSAWCSWTCSTGCTRGSARS
jgi:tellurite resistance protein TerC